MSEWKPVGERDSDIVGAYQIRDERAPWGRWLVGTVLFSLIVGGAVWLGSQVVAPGELPGPRGVVDIDPNAERPKSEDDLAWVRALEKDTLEGYREYLEGFPNGRHKDSAQAEIDAYDNRAWATAERRNTIAGYEDYIEAWPEGLHASKARERIAEMRAAAEARSADARERAAREASDWTRAASANTVESYQTYLRQHPSGANAAEAQSRIDRLQASAADQAAWDAASAANRAEAYAQYLTSFPQGAYVSQAMAAMESLRPAPGRTFQDCAECPTMVSLAGGTDTLGAEPSEAGARPNEKPARPVTLSGLYAIGVTEVTFDQWQACVDGGGCRPKADSGWGKGSRPVINVSWDDAMGYAKWLSAKTGHSYTLPTEAQWEFAARAGSDDALVAAPDALCAFANGANAESGLGWANGACTDPSADRTLPAGMLNANAAGLKDVIGNVAEWTLDCNTLNLRDAPTDGSADSRGSCGQRVTRGGSWFSGPSDLRFASRLMQRRGDSNDFTGFRVVRNIDG